MICKSCLLDAPEKDFALSKGIYEGECFRCVYKKKVELSGRKDCIASVKNKPENKKWYSKIKDNSPNFGWKAQKFEYRKFTHNAACSFN